MHIKYGSGSGENENDDDSDDNGAEDKDDMIITILTLWLRCSY
jgi:hypothetical protein